MEVIYCLIFVLYVFLILYLILGGLKIGQFKSNNLIADTYNEFTIIIPFRNEEKNLPDLLKSISKIAYPNQRYELILVDDDSTDRSIQCINTVLANYSNINYTIITRQPKTVSAKKDAITQAIELSTTDWIITTDADCTVPPNWLNLLNHKINQDNPNMIAGPVAYSKKTGILDLFQYYDLISLQGVTIGSFGKLRPFLCNGANFAYKKAFFIALNGFDGLTHIASGDDVLLLLKGLKKAPDTISYLLSSDNLVVTKTEKSWLNLFHQRVRWASKTSNYNELTPKIIGVIVLITNFSLLTIPFTSLRGINIMALYSIKWICDTLFIAIISKKLKLKYNIFEIALQSIIYPIFVTVVGTYSIVGKYNWKGRTNRK